MAGYTADDVDRGETPALLLDLQRSLAERRRRAASGGEVLLLRPAAPVRLPRRGRDGQVAELRPGAGRLAQR